MGLILRTDNDLQYLTKPPSRGVSQVKSLLGVDLLQLKKGKKKWTGSNVELRDGLPLLIYSPSSDRYWYRVLRHDHDMSEYRKYIKDGNLYIYWSEHWQKIVKAEVESEGLGYSKMILKRELILLDERLDRNRHRDDYHLKKSAIEQQLKQLTSG